jgi:transposase
MTQGFWLKDRQWEAIAPLLPQNQPGARRVDDRRVLSGILHMLKHGGRWQDCPRFYGPGKEAKLCFMGHALMENRNGLIVDALATRASGYAERLAALHLVEPRADRPRQVTLAGDKGFDTQDFVAELREINVTPHVAQNTSGRRSAIDGRTTRHPGYAVSQRIRKRIEEAFGWAKTVAGLRKARHRGLAKVDWQFTFAMAVYNLIRLPKLLVAAP